MSAGDVCIKKPKYVRSNMGRPRGVDQAWGLTTPSGRMLYVGQDENNNKRWRVCIATDSNVREIGSISPSGVTAWNEFFAELESSGSAERVTMLDRFVAWCWR